MVGLSYYGREFGASVHPNVNWEGPANSLEVLGLHAEVRTQTKKVAYH